MNRPWPLILALVVLALVRAGHAEDVAFKSGVFDPPRMAPDFELQGSNGSPLLLSRYRGKVVALAFGFTYCQRICPVTLANLAQVSTRLGAAAEDLQVVFVTVDPERDTPERLREYLAFFAATFVGGTGAAAQLQAVRQAYGVSAKRESTENKKLGYEVHHSSSIFLIDRAGKLRVLVPFGKGVEEILHDVKLLLRT